MTPAGDRPDPGGEPRIVISAEDLADPPPALPPPPSLPPMSQALPPLPPASSRVDLTGAGGAAAGVALARWGANTVVSGAMAGLLGGVAGAVVAEILASPDELSLGANLKLDAALWVAVFGAFLGFALQAWDGFTSGSTERALRDGAIGAAVGAVAGFVGGWVAQALFESLLETIDFSASQSDIENRLLLARAAGWGIFGGVAGFALGLPGGKRRAVNGVIGGLSGGVVGGIIFEQVAKSATGGGSGFMLRLVGLTMTGVGIGLGIGLVERLRRDAWLVVSGGPMAGKEFILYKEATTVGSDYHADIVLTKDPGVAPIHLTFARAAGRGTFLRAAPGAAVVVNGQPVDSHSLRGGDRVVVGRTTIDYQERALE